MMNLSPPEEYYESLKNFLINQIGVYEFMINPTPNPEMFNIIIVTCVRSDYFEEYKEYLIINLEKVYKQIIVHISNIINFTYLKAIDCYLGTDDNVLEWNVNSSSTLKIGIKLKENINPNYLLELDKVFNMNVPIGWDVELYNLDVHCKRCKND